MHKSFAPYITLNLEKLQNEYRPFMDVMVMQTDEGRENFKVLEKIYIQIPTFIGT